MLDRDAIVIGDGGDFVSYAGRVVETYEPGCWLDPGPFGCLGSGPGYAIAAKVARPDKQVCLLLGDGAFGFSGMEFDTMVRHGLPVVAVIGNNGIWALEKHPMEFLYGYSVAAELRPETRYDQVVEALGGHGELVERPEELRPGARARVRVGQAGVRERAHGPVGDLPAQREPRLGRSLNSEEATGKSSQVASSRRPRQDGQGYVPLGAWAVRATGGAVTDAAAPGPMWGARTRNCGPQTPRRIMKWHQDACRAVNPQSGRLIHAFGPKSGEMGGF